MLLERVPAVEVGRRLGEVDSERAIGASLGLAGIFPAIAAMAGPSPLAEEQPSLEQLWRLYRKHRNCCKKRRLAEGPRHKRDKETWTVPQVPFHGEWEVPRQARP